MNRKLMLMTVAIIATATAQAQYVTYNHDSPKQNQITVCLLYTSDAADEL